VTSGVLTRHCTILTDEGYFEQFREGNKFEFTVTNVEIGNETESTRTDLVRRKWLDNHFYSAVWSLDYTGING
jgi:iron complex outermembrane receptor protein